MTKRTWMAGLGALLVLAGCGGDAGTDAGQTDGGGLTDTGGGNGDGGSSGGSDAGPGTDAAPPGDAGPLSDTGPAVDGGPVADGGPGDAGGPSCPDVSARTVMTISGEITADRTLDCAHIWELAGGPVYVASGVTLTVEPGTIVRGQIRNSERRCNAGTRNGMVCTTDDDNATTGCPGGTNACGAPAEEGTALVVTRGGRLVAEGTREQPIVFTSANTTNPAPGNWGGIVLLGSAPTNNDPPDMAQIEGLPPTTGRGVYGGTDAASSCGSLRYVRIEYAGYIFGRNNELNGLTVGGCGSGTELEYIQVHRGLDDGIEFFGGTVNVKHAIVTGTGDDSLDYDLGWTGNVQFFIAQQRNAPGEERCIEGDNHPSTFNRTPQTRPTIFNFTCIGAGVVPGVNRATLSHDGAIIRRGASANLENSIFYGSPDNGIQIDNTTTMDPASQLYQSGTTVIAHNILFSIGQDGMSMRPFNVDDPGTTMRGTALEAQLAAANRVVDPMFPATVIDFTAPDFRPASSGPTTSDVAAIPTTPAGFFEAAPYIGAVDPGATGELWYQGWTRFTN